MSQRPASLGIVSGWGAWICGLVINGLALVGLVLGGLAGCSASLPEQPASGVPGRIEIASLTVAHVYHDFAELTEAQKRWTRLEVFFDVPEDEIGPEDLTSLRVESPAGFRYTFPNQKFVTDTRLDLGASLGGYVRNVGEGYFWYQGLRLGFLSPGTYTVTATFTDGSESSFSRELVANPGLLDAYLAHRAALIYTPSGGADQGSASARDTTLAWTPLSARGGPDAYYNAWYYPGMDGAVDPALARGDSIVREALNGGTDAGLNENSSRIGTSDAPLAPGPYQWHPQISDSNLLDQTNLIIFPPLQHFTAE